MFLFTNIFFPARKKQADKLKKLSSVKTDSCDTESVNDDGKVKLDSKPAGKLSKQILFSSQVKSIDKVLSSAAAEDAASKELWKQEKKLRFLIRRCCKVKSSV